MNEYQVREGTRMMPLGSSHSGMYPHCYQGLFVDAGGPTNHCLPEHCLCNHLTFFGSTFLVMPKCHWCPPDQRALCHLWGQSSGCDHCRLSLHGLCASGDLGKEEGCSESGQGETVWFWGMGGRSRCEPLQKLQGMEPRWGIKRLDANLGLHPYNHLRQASPQPLYL